MPETVTAQPQPGHPRWLAAPTPHIQPHLAIGDVAAGQGRFLIGMKNPLPIRPAVIASRRAPSGAALFAGFPTSVGLRPPAVTNPATLSHPDCRPPLTLFAALQV